MSKRTIGERIWQRVQDSAFTGLHQPYSAQEIDAAVRREKAKAWDQGMRARVIGMGHDDNPYRGRAKR